MSLHKLAKLGPLPESLPADSIDERKSRGTIFFFPVPWGRKACNDDSSPEFLTGECSFIRAVS